MSFLNRVLNARHLPSLLPDTDPTSAFAPLPNPQLWALAAQSYAQLSSEWPQLGSPDGTRQQGIVATGQQYSAAREKLAADTSLMPALIQNYRDSVSALGTAIDTDARTRFEAEVLSVKYGHGTGDPAAAGVRPNVLGDAAQVISWAPELLTLALDFYLDAPLACPDGILNLIPAEIRLAEWFQPSNNFDVRAYASQVTKDEWVTDPETGKRSLDPVIVGWSLEWFVNYAHVAQVGTCSVDITADVQKAFGSINKHMERRGRVRRPALGTGFQGKADAGCGHPGCPGRSVVAAGVAQPRHRRRSGLRALGLLRMDSRSAYGDRSMRHPGSRGDRQPRAAGKRDSPAVARTTRP